MINVLERQSYRGPVQLPYNGRGRNMDGFDLKDGYGTLGVDAGGTFTDFAFVRDSDSVVESTVKTPTDHGDLIATIERGLDLTLKQVPVARIKAVNIATTLATNAIAEDKLRPCALFLIGYDDASVLRFHDSTGFGADHIFLVNGGHDVKGNEKEPFNKKQFMRICENVPSDIKSVAISSFFSVRNPAHELLAKDIIHSLRPQMHVTCGHELATELDAMKRATTAAINAGLIPLIIKFLNSVKKVFSASGLNVPVTIVRGDGSIVSLDWASAHPIETVLSGPAASAVGAGFLSGAVSFGGPSVVVDIGGTTTDIINLDEHGAPLVRKEGTSVGGRDTFVKAIDIFTFGLGGDSRIRLFDNRDLLIGPRRVTPLCRITAENPAVCDQLRECLTEEKSGEPLIVRAVDEKNGNGAFEERMLKKLVNGPMLLERLIAEEPHRHGAVSLLEDMDRRGVVCFAGFTPTDALVVLGRLKKWNAEASLLGARIIMRDKQISPEAFCEKVCDKVSRITAKSIFLKKLNCQNFDFGDDVEKIIEYALYDTSPHTPAICLKLNSMLIGVGAPAWAFMGKVGDLLSHTAIIPEHAEAGGAIGAAAGVFSLKYAVLVSPMTGGVYRGHLPVGVKDFAELEEAVSGIKLIMTQWLAARAKIAGAAAPCVDFRREDVRALTAGGAREIHLCTYLYFSVADKNGHGKS